jgi:ubiquinone/menaquinone biosynthesis C-methylase UbiE
MGTITGMRIAGAVAVAGIAGIAARLGHGAFGHLMAHHNDLFVGQGSVWYDRLSPLLLGRLYRRVVDEVLATQPTGVVLDVGCGPGHLALTLARRAPGLSVRGVDISADMVQRASENAAEAGLTGRVRFDLSERTRLPYESGSVDLAVTTLSMHHWDDVAGMLRELARVVRPGGQIWIYDVWQPAMDAAGLAAAVPDGSFGAPCVDRMDVWVGPLPIRRFVRCTIERQ